MSVAKKHELEKELCDALGLKDVQKLDLHFAVDHFATAEVKMLLKDEQLKKIISVVKKYNLKADEETSQELFDNDSIDFGAENFTLVGKVSLPVAEFGFVEENQNIDNDAWKNEYLGNWTMPLDRDYTSPVVAKDFRIPEINDWAITVLESDFLKPHISNQIDSFSYVEINPCIGCNLFFPHIDDVPVIVCLQKAKSGELPTCKENCSKYLANNGTCPHY